MESIAELNDRRAVSRSVRISAVLPAYNEEAVIEQSVLETEKVLKELADDFEIIVTDDGSEDGTARVLANLQQRRPDLPLRVVTHRVNQGYGAALASGFDAARHDLVFFTDSDRQFDVRELSLLLPEIGDQADLVIGWRKKRADSPMRLLNAWGWRLLVNGLFGYTARDVDCAFKLFRREVWQSLTVGARGATFSAEFLVKARRLGFKVREVPVSHYPRPAGRATGARLSVITRAFLEIFRLWRNLDHQLASDPRRREQIQRRPSHVH